LLFVLLFDLILKSIIICWIKTFMLIG